MLAYLRMLVLVLLTLLLTPILSLLAAALLIFNAVHAVARLFPRRLPHEDASLSGLASIVILNWNGRDLLAQGLPSVLAAVHSDGRPHEILVVDNGSTDGSLEYVRTAYPEVHTLALPENLGFAAGNNAGVRAAAHDIVVLLNNDMIVDAGFLRPLLDGFGPKTFAVSSQIYLQDANARREETGKTRAVFRRGMMDYSHCILDGKSLERAYYPSFWAGGGSSAFHRARFLMLGGFHELYSPAYVEDTDLSYQAWKLGWEILFAPASVVYHQHRASSNRRFSRHELQALIARNQFLFIWKNIHSWRLLLAHCLFLPWNCYRLARDFGLGVLRSLFQGALRIPSVEAARLSMRYRAARSDTDVLELFSKPGLFFASLRAAPPDEAQESPMYGNADSRGTRGSGAQFKVLWLTAYLPHLGRHAGAGRMFHLLDRLSRKHRITLLTFLEGEDERELLPEVASRCEKVIALRRVPPLRWQLFPYEPFDEFRTPEMQEALQECLENDDFDLIQLEYSQMACYADKAFGIPTVLTKHEVDFAACARRARLETNAWRKFRWFYNYLQVLDREVGLVRRVDGVICMTEPDADELKKYCREVPVHVIPTGVDLDFFRPPERPTDTPRLVFVGAFQHQPNVDAMLHFCREILPLVRTQMPQTELVIVGSKPPPGILGLADIPGVQVTGWVPDIRPYMADSAVYIVPLRLGVGIRGKILEAWGMALPVVATRVACAGLRCEDGRNLLIADGADRFASSVARLLKEPELGRRLGTEGRKAAEQFYSWDTAARQLDSLYRQCVRA